VRVRAGGGRGTIYTRVTDTGSGLLNASGACMNCYVFQVLPSNGLIQLSKMVGGGWSPSNILHESYISVANGWNFTVRVRIEGNLIKCYVDDMNTPRFTVTDNTFSSGTFGFQSYLGAYLDDILVNPDLDCVMASPTPTVTTTRTESPSVTPSVTVSPTATCTSTVTATASTTPTPTASETAEEGGSQSARVDPKGAPSGWLKGEQALMAAPNPARRELWVAYRVTEGLSAQLVLYDIAGARVLTLGVPANEASEQRVKVDVGGLVTGVYFLQLEVQGVWGPVVQGRFKVAVVH
jgi:hypothetical protein